MKRAAWLDTFIDDGSPVLHIPLSGGMAHALIDRADFDLITFASWQLHDCGYATTNGTVNGKRRKVYMHRVIADARGLGEVDHHNNQRLDNRRQNLRPATRALQTANSSRRSDNTSGYKGVDKPSTYRRWRARIVVDGRQVHLGLYDTSEDAARAYDAAAVDAWGEFACPNFPEVAPCLK